MSRCNRKLTNNDAIRARMLFRDGMYQKDIAKMLHVDQTSVSSIVNGLTYSDVSWPAPFMSGKVFKSLPKFPGYKFDDYGNAYSFKQNKRYGRQLKLQLNQKGYLMVTVVDKNGKPFRLRMNRVICTLFIGPAPTSSHQARHLNGVKTDNRVLNLAWGTQKTNEADKIRHHGRNSCRGIKNSNAKLTEEQVKEIRASKLSGYKLSKIYGISQVSISNVIRRATWKHVSDPC